MVVDAVGRERKAVAVEPMMPEPEHLRLQVVANAVNQLNLKKRLTTYEVPHHARLGKVGFMPQDIVNRRLRGFPRHSLLLILTHQVTILASQLAVLRHNEGDVFGNAALPWGRLFSH